MTRYLNEGNDVMNGLDIKRALGSNNGVKGVVLYVVECACFKHKRHQNNWNQLIT